MAKKKPNKNISNSRARYDYDLKDSYIVGIELTGAEVRAIRTRHAHIRGAYVNIRNRQLWLINATISGPTNQPIPTNEQTRSRRLLASKEEIEHIERDKEKGMTVVPLELLPNGKYIKVRIATGLGKKTYDKRQTIKARNEERRINRYVHRPQ